MTWIIKGKWRHKNTNKIYHIKAFAITHKNENSIDVLNNYYDFYGMIFLDGTINRTNNLIK